MLVVVDVDEGSGVTACAYTVVRMCIVMNMGKHVNGVSTIYVFLGKSFFRKARRAYIVAGLVHGVDWHYCIAWQTSMEWRVMRLKSRQAWMRKTNQLDMMAGVSHVKTDEHTSYEQLLHRVPHSGTSMHFETIHVPNQRNSIDTMGNWRPVTTTTFTDNDHKHIAASLTFTSMQHQPVSGVHVQMPFNFPGVSNRKTSVSGTCC